MCTKIVFFCVEILVNYWSVSVFIVYLLFECKLWLSVLSEESIAWLLQSEVYVALGPCILGKQEEEEEENNMHSYTWNKTNSWWKVLPLFSNTCTIYQVQDAMFMWWMLLAPIRN